MSENAPRGRRRPSIHDVASDAGVSAATVSKVMRGNKTVKDENARRVFASIAKLKYRVDPIAANLKRERRNIIGVIVPDFQSAFFGGIVAELEVQAERRGYALASTSSRESVERERGLIARMNDWRVAGLILAPVHNESEPSRLIAEVDLKAVMIDRVIGDGPFDTVTADGDAASAEVARALVAAGHRRFLVVTLDEQAASRQAGRLDRFIAEVGRLRPGATVDVVRGPYGEDALRAAVAGYFDAGGRPSAVYCLFLRATLVTLSELGQRGLKVPDAVSVVGFDDADWMQVMHPPVACVAQPVAAIARRALERLFGRIEGLDGPALARLEECTVRMRGSIAPPPDRT